MDEGDQVLGQKMQPEDEERKKKRDSKENEMQTRKRQSCKTEMMLNFHKVTEQTAFFHHKWGNRMEARFVQSAFTDVLYIGIFSKNLKA